MTGLRNLKKILTQIFLLLLILTTIWISIEHYASEEYFEYYKKLNISIMQSSLTNKFIKYLAGGMNFTVLTEVLQSKKYITSFLEDTQAMRQIANLPNLNLTFSGIFMEQDDIKNSTLNMFFIESSCATEEMAKAHNTGDFLLTARQCCSIESAARTNPKRDVYILHTCLVGDDFLLRTPKYVRKLLLNHMNVHIIRYNESELLAGTPVQDLWFSGQVSGSQYRLVHASDILRLVLLWRFGGMYFDLDVITLRCVDELQTNFCGLESNILVGNAILNFEPSGYGHDMLTEALQHLNKHYNGEKWGANGPELATRMAMQACNVSVIEKLLNCSSFKIYHRSILYPLYWRDRKKIFDKRFGEDMVKTIKETAFTIHFWNKMSHQYKIEVGSSQGYSLLAEEFCPDVYFNCGQIF